MYSLLALFAILFIWFIAWLRDTIFDYIGAKNYEANKKIVDSFLEEHEATSSQWDEVVRKVDNNDDDICHLRIRLTKVIGFEPSPAMLRWGYLARKYGKVPHGITDMWRGYGYNNPLMHSHDATYSSILNMDMDEYKAGSLRFLKWYDYTLEQNGGLRLGFIQGEQDDTVCGLQQYRLANFKPLSKCKKLTYHTVVFWYSLWDCVPDVTPYARKITM